jgi:hypothetical protein
MSKIGPIQQNNVPASTTNGGTAGGSLNYINLGGLKYCWGITGSISISGGQATATVAFPSSFFTATPTMTLGGIPSSTVDLQAHLNGSPTTVGVTLAVDATTGTQTGSMIIHWLAIGT